MTKSNVQYSSLTVDNVNKHVVDMEYAVRGAVPTRAYQILKEMDKDASAYPFDKIISCNIGDPQDFGQKPITFVREVSSLVECPHLLKDENYEVVSKLFSKDSIKRAKRILDGFGNGIGIYTESFGLMGIRKNVAKYIEMRDGHPSDPEYIQLSNGASAAIYNVLKLMISHENVGVMTSVPQYPIYTALVASLGGKSVPYYLDESKNWGMDITGLEKAYEKAKSEGIHVRCIAIINPGNPTGGVLTYENMVEIVKFCERNNMCLIADEVYQKNIYMPDQFPFVSFKKVVCDLKSPVTLFSFNSISKGFMGECGRRGGYLEMHNVSYEIKELLLKIASVFSCSNTLGQIAVDLMVDPPRPDEESHILYNSESTGIISSLRKRSLMLHEAFNKQEGIECNPAQGAMYLFPKIKLPEKFIDECESMGKSPDLVYCIKMLEATGVCVVPGDGFGKIKGEYHFRSTFLPPEGDFDIFVSKFGTFHSNFLKQYS